MAMRCLGTLMVILLLTTAIGFATETAAAEPSIDEDTELQVWGGGGDGGGGVEPLDPIPGGPGPPGY